MTEKKLYEVHKTILNLENPVWEWFNSMYGSNIGVSAAVRTLMRKHMESVKLKQTQKER